MARPLWKGSISFGLVNIPVELHVGSRDHTPHFRLLHRKDMSPISLERVCQNDGKTVAWDDLVKGYEISKGRFIALEDEDFKSVAIERSRSIDIRAFVPVSDIDTRYFDTPYVALPGKGAEHAYGLFAQALEKSGRAGIAKFVMRQREHLTALIPARGCLVVSTMRFEEDLVELPRVSRAKVNAQELKLADQLINHLAGDWNPDAYHDDYVPALMKVIKAKAAGKKMPAVSEKPTPPTKVVDLVARLRESLAEAQKASRPRRASRTASTSVASRSRARRGRRPAA